jgi:hypothetical protein
VVPASGAVQPSTYPGVDVTCQAVAADTWRRREDPSLTYLVRRDGVLVQVVGGADTPEAALRQAAATLAPRPPAHLLPLER